MSAASATEIDNASIERVLHAAGWPAMVPLLQLTTRPGTPHQKTHQLRRAVTIIGSSPSAHVTLRHVEVSKTHAAIICDGTEPIVCDLASRNGTILCEQRVSTAPLHDGEVLRIGPYDMRVQTQPLPGSRGKNYESGQFPATRPLAELRLHDAGGSIALRRSAGAAVVGTREGCDLIVQSDVGPAVAILTPWRGRWAVYDLAAEDESQTRINGQPVLSAVLQSGDELQIAGRVLRVEYAESDATAPNDASDQREEAEAVGATPSAPVGTEPAASSAEDGDKKNREVAPMSQTKVETAAPAGTASDMAPEAVLGGLEQKLASLQADIASSWSQLHEYQQKVEQKAREVSEHEQLVQKQVELASQRADELSKQAGVLGERQKELDARAAELDKRHAEVEQAQTQLAAMQKDVDAKRQQIDAEKAQLTTASAELQSKQAACEKLTAEAEARQAELNALSQELDSQRNAIARQQQEIDAARASLETDANALQAEREAFQTEREQAQAEGAEIDRTKAELDEQAKRLQAEFDNVAALEESVRQQQAHFEQRERDLNAREEDVLQRELCLEDFRASLTRIVEAFDLDAPPPHAEANVSATPEPLGAQESDVSSAAPDDGEAPVADAPADVVDAAESDAPVGVAEADAEAAAPVADEPTADAPAPQPAAAAEPQIDLASLPPEVQGKLRMMRRLAGGRKSDAELLAQIKKSNAGAAAHEPEAEKRRWFRRR